jgi:hypothetical protein
MHAKDGIRLVLTLTVVGLSSLLLLCASVFHLRFGKPAGAGLLHSGLAMARFTIADLDGDLKPDLATVEIESQRSARTNYSIRVQLSAGTQSAISLNAPMGGLRLSARDVNGDDSLDLIVTSISEARVIAVLLNDGHGRFFVASNNEYVVAKETDIFLREREAAQPDTLTLAPSRRTPDGACSSAAAGSILRPTGVLREEVRYGSPSAPSRGIRSRAPPSDVFLA